MHLSCEGARPKSSACLGLAKRSHPLGPCLAESTSPENVMKRSTTRFVATAVATLAGLAAMSAQAQAFGTVPVVAQILERNVMEQERIAQDLAHGHIATADAAVLLAREGRLYGLESQAFAMGPSGAELRGLVEMQAAVLQARRALEAQLPVASGVPDLQARELMLLARRDAGEQRKLLSDWASGRLALAQLGGFEQRQAGAVVAATESSGLGQ